MYFAGAEAVKMDARQCLAAARSKVLAGVHIVFSRIFPQLMTRPETHSLWQLAIQVRPLLSSPLHCSSLSQMEHFVLENAAVQKQALSDANDTSVLDVAFFSGKFVERNKAVLNYNGLVAAAAMIRLSVSVRMAMKPAPKMRHVRCPKGKPERLHTSGFCNDFVGTLLVFQSCMVAELKFMAWS